MVFLCLLWPFPDNVPLPDFATGSECCPVPLRSSWRSGIQQLQDLDSVAEIVTRALFKKLADMATSGLEIQPSQHVEIRGDMSMQECIDAVSLAVERVEAIPCLNVTSISHEAERIRTLPRDWLRQPSPFLFNLARTVGAVIVIERDWSSLAALCPAEKLEAWNQAVGLLVEQQESRRIPYCLIRKPGGNRPGSTSRFKKRGFTMPSRPPSVRMPMKFAHFWKAPRRSSTMDESSKSGPATMVA